MLTKRDVVALMTKWNVDSRQLADATTRTIETVRNWRTGVSTAPDYLGLTIEAVARGLKPARVETMRRYELTELGISTSIMRYWKMTEQFPMAARLAVACLVERNRTPATEYQRRLLHAIGSAGRYWRTIGGYRMRGFPGRTIKLKTMADLIGHGWVEKRNGYVILSERGKREINQ